MNIRRRGVDTSVLLRNQLTRMGTEMWVKVYSPTVVGIEVVQRAEKRARRARLYYMRYVHHHPKDRETQCGSGSLLWSHMANSLRLQET